MEFVSLKILDKFQRLFEGLGIDYKLMRAILKTKLILDTRRVPVIGQQNRKHDSGSTSLIKRYFMHLLFGVFLAFFIYFIKDEMIRMIYFTGAFFFMTTMYLISDFSYVLLDIRDKNILMTRPVDLKVISLSKVLHILIYMFRLNAFIAGPSMITVVLLDGPAAILVFLPEILLMDLLIFLVTAFIYLLVLRFFDGEMLRNIINFIQILLTVLVTVGYQIAVRMIDFSGLQKLSYNFRFHNFFNPILWFGAPFEIIFNGGREGYLFVFTALLVAVPLICFVIYLRLSKKMESLLLKLEGEGKERHSKHRIELLAGRILIGNEAVRQPFHFANAVMRSDRSLKLKIYPALATGVLIPVLMIFNTGMRGQSYEASGYEYLYLYFSLLMIPTVIDLTMYSSAWRGSYVYIASGFKGMNELYEGILKSVELRFLNPLLILNAAVYIALFGKEFVPDILVLIFAGKLILPILGRIYFTELPFSMPVDESNQNKSLGKFFTALGIMVCLAILHVISRMVPMGTLVYALLLIMGEPLSRKLLVPKKAKV